MTSRRKPIPLQLKLTLVLVMIVMVPFGVATYLVDSLGKAAANVAASDADARVVAMEQAIDRYHELVDITKQLHGEVAARLAQRPDIVALSPAAELRALVTDPDQPGLRALAILRPDGSVVAEAERPSSGPAWRDKVVDQPIGTSGAALRLTFEVSASLQHELQELKGAIDGTRTVTQIQSALPDSYYRTFLIVLLITTLVVAMVGIVWSTVWIRRIDKLVAAARSVSEGKHETRVDLAGARDEMAELGDAFNTMLDDLEAARRQVEHLQRMGVWQRVARELAHEIKNPLTPIQLAVQQCVSAYKGADTDHARFARTLRDAGEIVEEEIAGLRRLVDTFRTLGALPKVEAAPLALGEVIEELKLDPTMAARLTLRPPAEPVTVPADKLLLKRVLTNLVENGMHAGQEAGTPGDVVIAWTRDVRRGVVRITVDDHGKGVPVERREKIFEPHVTTKATGTGLGLAISRKIAIEHGGDLEIADEPAPTGGARFVVSLPLTRAERPAA